MEEETGDYLNISNRIFSIINLIFFEELHNFRFKGNIIFKAAFDVVTNEREAVRRPPIGLLGSDCYHQPPGSIITYLDFK